MTISELGGPCFKPSPLLSGLTGVVDRRLIGVGGSDRDRAFTEGRAAFQPAEAYLLSAVCHCPSASTMTSSTSSDVFFKISSK